jgi:hypothetical protein
MHFAFGNQAIKLGRRPGDRHPLTLGFPPSPHGKFGFFRQEGFGSIPWVTHSPTGPERNRSTTRLRLKN